MENNDKINNIKVYNFDTLFMAYKGIYLYVHNDPITREIKFRLEDENTINNRNYGFSKNVIDNITLEEYLNYVKESMYV